MLRVNKVVCTCTSTSTGTGTLGTSTSRHVLASPVLYCTLYGTVRVQHTALLERVAHDSRQRAIFFILFVPRVISVSTVQVRVISTAP